jgi:hypothetical protein
MNTMVLLWLMLVAIVSYTVAAVAFAYGLPVWSGPAIGIVVGILFPIPQGISRR